MLQQTKLNLVYCIVIVVTYFSFVQLASSVLEMCLPFFALFVQKIGRLFLSNTVIQILHEDQFCFYSLFYYALFCD